MIGGHPFIVQDITSTTTGKLITFTTGEHFTMLAHSVLWAARRMDPRRRPAPVTRKEQPRGRR
ncbi:hypothetical protein [Streptomyces sp. SBT349]|uniref:hypothetical protein n=1 Tax=Streptomyces sp. SBT349 TaxID=1580539 RepID=UPI00066CE751|nr:hypothetical protein [Streptomyces sp. SBT349]